MKKDFCEAGSMDLPIISQARYYTKVSTVSEGHRKAYIRLQ